MQSFFISRITFFFTTILSLLIIISTTLSLILPVAPYEYDIDPPDFIKITKRASFKLSLPDLITLDALTLSSSSSLNDSSSIVSNTTENDDNSILHHYHPGLPHDRFTTSELTTLPDLQTLCPKDIAYSFPIASGVVYVGVEYEAIMEEGEDIDGPGIITDCIERNTRTVSLTHLKSPSTCFEIIWNQDKSLTYKPVYRHPQCQQILGGWCDEKVHCDDGMKGFYCQDEVLLGSHCDGYLKRLIDNRPPSPKLLCSPTRSECVYDIGSYFHFHEKNDSGGGNGGENSEGNGGASTQDPKRIDQLILYRARLNFGPNQHYSYEHPQRLKTHFATGLGTDCTPGLLRYYDLPERTQKIGKSLLVSDEDVFGLIKEDVISYLSDDDGVSKENTAMNSVGDGTVINMIWLPTTPERCTSRLIEAAWEFAKMTYQVEIGFIANNGNYEIDFQDIEENDENGDQNDNFSPQKTKPPPTIQITHDTFQLSEYPLDLSQALVCINELTLNLDCKSYHADCSILCSDGTRCNDDNECGSGRCEQLEPTNDLNDQGEVNVSNTLEGDGDSTYSNDDQVEQVKFCLSYITNASITLFTQSNIIITLLILLFSLS